MKTKPTKFLERHRVRNGELASDESDGMNGAFVIKLHRWHPQGYATAMVVCSDRRGWDHVSVHIETPLEQRCPTWEEIDYIRKLFFRGDEWVMQLHAPADKNINEHPYTLHLWRPQNESIPVPPRDFV